MIECSNPGTNNMLPPDTQVSIVIDHHQAEIEEIRAEYVDIRPNIGATATIMTKYLQDLIYPSIQSLPQLFYTGSRWILTISAGTQTCRLIAAAYLTPLANQRHFEQDRDTSRSIEEIEILGMPSRTGK